MPVINKTNQKMYGQYNTPTWFVDLIYEHLKPHGCFYFDLGAGMGNLSSPLRNADGLCIEIDPHRVNHLKDSNRKVKIGNVLTESIIRPNIKTLWISNPPFHLEQCEYNYRVLKSLNKKNSRTQLDVAFLDVVLSVSKPEDEILFIMSSPFFESDEYLSARQLLSERYNHIKVITLPVKLFHGAIVQSHLMHAKNVNIKDAGIYLSALSLDCLLSNPVKVSASENLNYHKKLLSKKYELIQSKNHETLRSIGCQIIRGSRTINHFRERDIFALHSSDTKTPILNLNHELTSHKHRYVTKGDILIPRVGSNIIGRASLIQDGVAYYSDACFRIRPPCDLVNEVWNCLNSEFGREWMQYHAKGKCAKFLTIEAVLNFPLVNIQN